MRATGKRGRAGDPESGFVMLMVFVMAAAIAIMLYMELPRVAFEAQRNKEALLIERGEQYKRAIQLYFRKFKRYPTSMEQLESTNNLRFLRRRYKDPLTGKDEWRLIHIGPTGAFIDSLTNKPGNDKDKKPENLNTFITEGGGIGAGLPTTGANNGQPPRRASEQAALNAALDPTAGGTIPNPGANPIVGGQLLNPQGGSPFPTSVPAGVVPVSAFNLPAQTGTPGIAPDGSVQPSGSGFGSSAGQGFGNSGFGSSGGQGFGQSQGQGFGQQQGQQQGFNAGQPGANQAANLMLSQLLTTPRNTNNFVTPGPGLGTPAVGGGIAGVASTVEKTGIKIYNERSKYNEWEFIYDFGKDRTGMGQLAGQMGSADPRLANSGQNSQSGFGGQGGVGQGGIGQGGQTGGFGGQAGAQAGFGGAVGFGRTGAGQAGATGGIGSSAGGVGSGYGGGIGSGFTPPPAAQAQPQPARQPATPQQQPAPQPHPQQAQPAQPQPAQPQPVQPPPQPAPPPQAEPTPAAPEPTPEPDPAPAPDPQTEVAPPVPDPPIPDPPPGAEAPPQ